MNLTYVAMIHENCVSSDSPRNNSLGANLKGSCPVIKD